MIARWEHVDQSDNSRFARLASISLPDSVERFDYSTSFGPVSSRGDALLVASLLSAMRMGVPLHIDADVSPQLLAATSTIQDIYRAWDRAAYRRVEVTATAIREAPGGPDVACFFTGGLDSFYTLLTHRQEITKLLYVDFPLKPEPIRSEIKVRLRECAALLGLPLIEVITGIRSFTDRHTDWETCFGSTLISVAHALAPAFGIVYLSAGRTYADLIPEGSHPVLDPLWSSEGLRVINYGCAATRVEKLAIVAQSEIALRYLQVCWQHRGGAYNCGLCPKCLNTMTSLRILGVLERCTTFGAPLSLPRLAWMGLGAEKNRLMINANLVAASERGTDRALELALRLQLDRGDWDRFRRLVCWGMRIWKTFVTRVGRGSTRP